MAEWERCPGTTFYKLEQVGGVHPKLVFVDPINFVTVNIARERKESGKRLWVRRHYLDPLRHPYVLLGHLPGLVIQFRKWVELITTLKDTHQGWKDELLAGLDRDWFWRKQFLWAIHVALTMADENIVHDEKQVSTPEEIKEAFQDYDVPAC